MKKVLIISFYFPPLPDIGSQRPYRLVKYLPKYGWEPTVLTIKRPGKIPEGFRIIETDYKDVTGIIKSKFGFNPEKGLHEQLGISVSKNFKYLSWKSKLIKLTKEVISFPDGHRGWYKFALKSAYEFLSKENVDVIISTSSPVTSHLIARKLKQKYKIPWVADLRDLWTQNHFYNKFDLIRYFERRLELKTLSNADALVTVTKPFADTLKNLHKERKVFCITNGYDPDDFPNIPSKLTNKFTITYTGQLYGGKRDPSLLFKVVARLIQENKINSDLVEIRFYGPKEDWLIGDIKKYNLEKVVSHYGFLPREVALKKQTESQLLLLLLDKNNKEEDVYPAKIFEYLGVKRPIIAIGGRGGITKNFLKKTNAGNYVYNADNLRNVLWEYYDEFIKFGGVRYHGNGNIENYNYEPITKNYSDVLNRIILS